MTPDAIIGQAIKEGLGLIAVTDHNDISNVSNALKAAENTALCVIPGVELSTSDGHLLVYFSQYSELAAYFGKLDIEGKATDLRRFQEQARKQFAAWTASLDPHQSRTDILGALDAARQELALLPQKSNRRLVVVSDFLEDDGTYRFVSDTSLAGPTQARQFAARLRAQHGVALQDVSLCLGRLESSDFVSLSRRRKKAIQAFWTAYFAAGDEPAEIQFDGMGILRNMEPICLGEER